MSPSQWTETPSFPRKTGARKGALKANPGFLGGAVVKNSPANAGDTGSSPGPG